ncbi:DUF397 domain-containing protein [Actinomadura sp. NAK00032]|uniref:DUF397 domain-containing protein n=1 Tax=Actinomadura sp. NAK00032 TaxID=2742128 RepID=UPI00159024D2|nr:DUF397 domain-containing protein [Actinomadura sp. NAK00032]QKW39649.1 DUF397 domain-containing protein [Actinomadura sp. NAK00032]
MDLSKAKWRSSSRSNESGDNCVEIAEGVSIVALRDSKDPDGSKILISRDDFREFAYMVKGL